MTRDKALTALRSSAAEYLTFIATNGESGVEALYADKNIWLTQKMMAALYDVETNTVNYHLKKYLLIMSYRKKQLFENYE